METNGATPKDVADPGLVQLLDLARDADATLLDRREAVEKMLVGTVFNLANLEQRKAIPELDTFLSASRKVGKETGLYGHIYRITNTETGQVYVGQSSRPFPERIKDHLEKSKAGEDKPLYAAMRDTPKAKFAVQILHIVWGKDQKALDAWQVKSAKALNKAETAYIQAENSKYSQGYGYNLTAGGAGTRSMDKHAALVRDIRMAVAKYGAMSIMKQAYVLWQADSGMGTRELAEKTGYTPETVARLRTGSRGKAVRELLPQITQILDEMINAKEKGQDPALLLIGLERLAKEHHTLDTHYHAPTQDQLEQLRTMLAQAARSRPKPETDRDAGWER